PSPSETVHSGGIAGLTKRHPRVVDSAVTLPAGNGFSAFRMTNGDRLIDSTPPVTTTSASATSIWRDAMIAASRLDPHNRLTVVPVTDVGNPASSTAIRATLRFSSPAPFALPNTTSSIRSGARSGDRATRADTIVAAKSSGRIPANAPPYLPNGVRTAS